MAEKRLIQEELAAEERRLNGIMEAEREKGLEFQEELERRRKQELIRCAAPSSFSPFPFSISPFPFFPFPFPFFSLFLSFPFFLFPFFPHFPFFSLLSCIFHSRIPSTRLEVLRQMEQHREQRALRAEQKFQEGKRVLERLEQMKREDWEVRDSRGNLGRGRKGWIGHD